MRVSHDSSALRAAKGAQRQPAAAGGTVVEHLQRRDQLLRRKAHRQDFSRRGGVVGSDTQHLAIARGSSRDGVDASALQNCDGTLDIRARTPQYVLSKRHDAGQSNKLYDRGPAALECPAQPSAVVAVEWRQIR